MGDAKTGSCARIGVHLWKNILNEASCSMLFCTPLTTKKALCDSMSSVAPFQVAGNMKAFLVMVFIKFRKGWNLILRRLGNRVQERERCRRSYSPGGGGSDTDFTSLPVKSSLTDSGHWSYSHSAGALRTWTEPWIDLCPSGRLCVAGCSPKSGFPWPFLMAPLVLLLALASLAPLWGRSWWPGAVLVTEVSTGWMVCQGAVWFP